MPTTIIVLPGLDGSCNLMGDFAQEFTDSLVQLIEYPKELSSYTSLLNVIQPKLSSQDQPNLFLVAESFGGPLAIKLAQALQTVKGVILFSSFLSPPVLGLKVTLSLPGIEKIIQATPDQAWDVDSLPVRLLMGKERKRFPEKAQLLSRALAELPKKTLLGRLRQLANFSLEPELDQGVHFHQIKGSSDALLPWLDQSKSTLIDGPHMLLETRPVECARMVKQITCS